MFTQHHIEDGTKYKGSFIVTKSLLILVQKFPAPWPQEVTYHVGSILWASRKPIQSLENQEKEVYYAREENGCLERHLESESRVACQEGELEREG